MQRWAFHRTSKGRSLFPSFERGKNKRNNQTQNTQMSPPNISMVRCLDQTTTVGHSFLVPLVQTMYSWIYLPLAAAWLLQVATRKKNVMYIYIYIIFFVSYIYSLYIPYSIYHIYIYMRYIYINIIFIGIPKTPQQKFLTDSSSPLKGNSWSKSSHGSKVLSVPWCFFGIAKGWVFPKIVVPPNHPF